MLPERWIKFLILYKKPYMFFYSTRRKIFRRIIEEITYYKVLLKSAKIKPGDKLVFVDVSDIALNRYLYNFLKFFEINGYTVFLPKNKRIISQLSKDKGEFKYASWILKEGFVKFDAPPKDREVIRIDKEQLSNDYFSHFFYNELEKENYHVPMSEYCSIYHCNNYREDYSIRERRKKSVFMIGNCNAEHYDNIGKEGIFNILTRSEIAEFIYEKEYNYEVLTVTGLIKFITGEIDEKVIIVDTKIHFNLPGDKLKGYLKKFDFYLGTPGIIIPQSHNIIEAISVGCIPILHITYANLFRPALRHKHNSFVYGSFEELDEIIKEVFHLPEVEIVNLRKNVSEYYKRYLSPQAVVENIETNTFSKIYIQAEGVRLHLLKTQRNRKK